MSYSCRIIADSTSEEYIRLTTFEITFPRIILSEFRTHRLESADDEAQTSFMGIDEVGRSISMNSGSSRAIPVSKILERVKDDPFIPVHWGENQKGMQAVKELSLQEQELAKSLWLRARDQSVYIAETLIGKHPISVEAESRVREDSVFHLNVHKQIANRLLEPWMWQTCIMSATNWSNFFAQRSHPDAQPEIRTISDMMLKEYNASTPKTLLLGEWHLPYIQEDELELPIDLLKKLSSARCARVSYLTQNGVRENDLDLDLFQRLISGSHWSPLEHVATPWKGISHDLGNYKGWLQYRKTFAEESR